MSLLVCLFGIAVAFTGFLIAWHNALIGIPLFIIGLAIEYVSEVYL